MAQFTLRSLECPICCEYLEPPIIPCQSGHCICNNCKKLDEGCRLCGEPDVNYRNVELENFAFVTLFPCYSSAYGCNDILPIQLVSSHKRECPYNTVCPMSLIPDVRCSWKGSVTTISNHLKVYHNKTIIERAGDFSSVFPDMFETPFPCRIIMMQQELIFYVWKRELEETTFSIFRITPGNNTKSFKFRILLYTSAQEPTEFSGWNLIRNLNSCIDIAEDNFPDLPCDYQVLKDYKQNELSMFKLEILPSSKRKTSLKSRPSTSSAVY